MRRVDDALEHAGDFAIEAVGAEAYGVRAQYVDVEGELLEPFDRRREGVDGLLAEEDAVLAVDDGRRCPPTP